MARIPIPNHPGEGFPKLRRLDELRIPLTVGAILIMLCAFPASGLPAIDIELPYPAAMDQGSSFEVSHNLPSTNLDNQWPAFPANLERFPGEVAYPVANRLPGSLDGYPSGVRLAIPTNDNFPGNLGYGMPVAKNLLDQVLIPEKVAALPSTYPTAAFPVRQTFSGAEMPHPDAVGFPASLTFPANDNQLPLDIPVFPARLSHPDDVSTGIPVADVACPRWPVADDFPGFPLVA